MNVDVKLEAENMLDDEGRAAWYCHLYVADKQVGYAFEECLEDALAVLGAKLEKEYFFNALSLKGGIG